jgi:hypothetical protein
MPAIDRLMKRLGYVKLSSYGLVLTPEGRVLSMRPAALDDGLGGRIVGWEEGDLAAMELEKWEPARPAPKAAVATRVAVPPRPPVMPTSSRQPIPSMIVRETALPVSVAQVPSIQRPAPVVAAKVAPEPVVEEDDWEWTIAIARARAAADEVELAASSPPPPAPLRFIAAKTLPIAKVAEIKPDPIRSDSWPKTEPLGEIDYNDYTSPMNDIVRVARMAHTPRVVLPAKPTPSARDYPRAKSPATVIPIPRLPTLANPNPRPFGTPVISVPSVISPARRLAKGTGPYLPKTAPMMVVPEPRHDDDTVPGMVLPPVLPSMVKRAQRG